MKKKTVKSKPLGIDLPLLAFCTLLAIIIDLFVFYSGQNKSTAPNPKDFSTNITNKYYSLPIGKRFVYETKTFEGLERDEVTTTGETKVIAGVTTLVTFDKVYLNGKLHEDTRDYLAQNKNGDLWYFGEDVDNYDKNGKFANHGGSWKAGVDGGQAGIWVMENPKVGESYRQEYLKGEAEDMVTTLSLNESITVRGKTYTNCMKTHEWTPLDPASLEDKYYCPGVNTTVLEHDLASNEMTELVSIK